MKIAAFDSEAIWGIGNNEEEAKDDADMSFRDICSFAGLKYDAGAWKTAPISEPLMEKVNEADGFFLARHEIPFLLGPDGLLWLDDGEGTGADAKLVALEEGLLF